MASSSVSLDKFDIMLFTKKGTDKKDMKDKTSDGTQFTSITVDSSTTVMMLKAMIKEKFNIKSKDTITVRWNGHLQTPDTKLTSAKNPLEYQVVQEVVAIKACKTEEELDAHTAPALKEFAIERGMKFAKNASKADMKRLILGSGASFNIFVKTLTGETITVSVQANDTINLQDYVPRMEV